MIGKLWTGVVFLGFGSTAFGFQESFLFSTSGTSQAWFGELEDQEIARFESSSGTVMPWLRTTTGRFFAGDVSGNGEADPWNDVDAISVRRDALGVQEVFVSLLSDLGTMKDGDVLRLTGNGGMANLFTEDEVITAFGIVDGNVDVDAFHYGENGTHLLSFAETEDSTIVSSDNPGEIFDGAILSWNLATNEVAVVHSEAQIDQFVSQALGEGVATLDVLGVSLGSTGELRFTVQSPSDHDASVFSPAVGGTLVTAEADLGLLNQAELNALSICEESTEFLSAQVSPNPVPGGEDWTLTVSGAPLQPFWTLLALDRAPAGWSGSGFQGLFLSPMDSLLWWSLGTPWLKGETDASGFATVSMPVVPAGFSVTLLGQMFVPGEKIFGTPFAVNLGS